MDMDTNIDIDRDISYPEPGKPVEGNWPRLWKT